MSQVITAQDAHCLHRHHGKPLGPGVYLATNKIACFMKSAAMRYK